MNQTPEAFAAFDRGEITCEASEGRCPNRATYLSGGGAGALSAFCDSHPLCACGNYVLHSKHSSQTVNEPGWPGCLVTHAWLECGNPNGHPFRRECSTPSGSEHERRSTGTADALGRAGAQQVARGDW